MAEGLQELCCRRSRVHIKVRHAVTDPELIAVLGRLAITATDMRDPVAAAVSARDDALFTVTRAGLLRGAKAGAVLVGGLMLRDGSSALGQLLPDLRLHRGAPLGIAPQRAKAEGPEPPPRWWQVGSAEACMDPAWWLHQMVKMSLLAGQRITRYLFRPCPHGIFCERPYTSSALYAMLKSRFGQAGMLAGQSPHGLRRGGV